MVKARLAGQRLAGCLFDQRNLAGQTKLGIGQPGAALLISDHRATLHPVSTRRLD